MTVTWTHIGGSYHDITSDDGEWTPQPFPDGADDFTHTFSTAGTYDYTCTVHSGMDGTIVVEAP